MSNYDDNNTGRSGYGGESGGAILVLGWGRGAMVYALSLLRRPGSFCSSLRLSPRVEVVTMPMDNESSGRESSGIGGDDSYGSSDRSTSAGYGSAITSGTGSGNKLTSGEQEPEGLPSDYGTGYKGDTTDRNEPYSGGREYGSGATSGVGYGNKTSSGSSGDSPYGGNPDTGRNSDPYTGQNEYGSGTTAGVGYGNKSSSKDDGDSKKGDSTSGKMMEKLGGMIGNEKMKEQGREKREGAGYGDKRANADIGVLIRRFENIIEYKPGDRNAAAVDAYKMEVETAALIRAAEDILSLTRTMKEMWLFGKLDTLGTDEADERADESARGVEEGWRKLMGAERK
ncbi:MAG: hypothetical protein L6R36_000059 [Xanthoria steineri]|nr:MAG: hypothetical protein L6R36_000059 [Xanthoria steineri]